MASTDVTKSALRIAVVLCIAFWNNDSAFAQKWHDDGFAYRRIVQVPSPGNPEIVVCQFFSHHAMDKADNGVAVFAKRDPVACRILQRGPGDLCRVAYQTLPGESRYSLYYGGQSVAGATTPEWTARSGLLLETRQWKSCDPGRLESVRRAFDAAEAIGADFVPQVFHRFNPLSGDAEPFLSRYSASLRVPVAGKCSFFTTSQDASFLLIDGQLVVSEPGRHPPRPVARSKGDVNLSEGTHQFEYYHAATGSEACMVAAWQLPGFDKPALIPESAFGQDRVAHLSVGGLEHRTEGFLPDFAIAVTADWPSQDGNSALVRVQFANTTPKEIARNAKYAWQFGDGQTSNEEGPVHVYLHPGPYEVELQMTRGLKRLTTKTVVQVPRHFIREAQEARQEPKLPEYLALLEKYNPQTLDALGLYRLVMTYLEADLPEKAVASAKAAFSPEAKQADQTRWDIVSNVGPVARFQLSDSRTAGEMWYLASRQIARTEWRLQCAVEAADILVNDLLSAAKARSVLDPVKDLVATSPPETKSHYYRALADCLARQGDGDKARAAMDLSVSARQLPLTAVERDARRGAHSRSTEAFLQSQELVRARTELERWQRDFPADKSEGYLSLLFMRYWMAAKKYEQALAVAGDLITLNRSSAYADRLVFLSAECEEQLGRTERARACLQSLLADYPGSPLVDKSKAEIERLQSTAPESSDNRTKLAPTRSQSKRE